MWWGTYSGQNSTSSLKSVFGIVLVHTKGSFTLQETDSGTDLDSNPIPLVSSWDWTLNLTPCSVKMSA